jgi:predicted nucleic acid-binding protein
LDNNILNVAAAIYVDLRKMGRPSEDSDIFIAAFCKCKGFALVTNNTKHFEHIPNLPLCDWTHISP